ncbi:hypothetical protein DB29_01518 [Shouchella clausii]|nr:hypothetical protein DB29_01518 [Shouchella clausii]
MFLAWSFGLPFMKIQVGRMGNHRNEQTSKHFESALKILLQ